MAQENHFLKFVALHVFDMPAIVKVWVCGS
jgi:hypothetical protein